MRDETRRDGQRGGRIGAAVGIGADRKHAAGVLLHDRRVRLRIFRQARVSDCRRSDMRPARSGVHIRNARSGCIRSRLCRHVWPQHLLGRPRGRARPRSQSPISTLAIVSAVLYHYVLWLINARLLSTIAAVDRGASRVQPEILKASSQSHSVTSRLTTIVRRDRCQIS